MNISIMGEHLTGNISWSRSESKFRSRSRSGSKFRSKFRSFFILSFNISTIINKCRRFERSTGKDYLTVEINLQFANQLIIFVATRE